ncbi:hypothetical protein [Streptomyces sp. NPDC049879]|uniref:hypothetical protein n=1 Tax=Streptomyces sp. NPDC049879 TaxID=3365598 RepID=UPI003797CC22
MTAFVSRLFTGGETGEARVWAREVLAAWGWSGAVPVVDVLIAVARSRRPWWLSLRDHGDALNVQVLRARTARTIRLPGRIAGADGLVWTFGTVPTPDGLCIWTTITPHPKRQPLSR